MGTRLVWPWLCLLGYLMVLNGAVTVYCAAQPPPPPQDGSGSGTTGPSDPPPPELVTLLSEPPGAKLSIDGTFRGRTPREVQLTPGQHKLRLELAGYQPLVDNLSVTSEGGGPFTYRLKPEDSRVLVKIKSEPDGATVSIDGRAAGRTELQVRLAEGKYTLRLEHPGYRPAEHDIEVSKAHGNEPTIKLVPLASLAGDTVVLVVENQPLAGNEKALEKELAKVHAAFSKPASKRRLLGGALWVVSRQAGDYREWRPGTSLKADASDLNRPGYRAAFAAASHAAKELLSRRTDAASSPPVRVVLVWKNDFNLDAEPAEPPPVLPREAWTGLVWYGLPNDSSRLQGWFKALGPDRVVWMEAPSDGLANSLMHLIHNADLRGSR